MLRFADPGVRQALKVRAAVNRRSLNAEILCLIDAGLKAQKENAPLVAASEALDLQ
ncbi:Arc family DNA-binding protein [Achromobacter xylosoxidans]|nr:Arc family DNA-binding protein [Achromobacter xylosoxidans]